MEPIILTSKFANMYLIDSLSGRIMIDAGWPDTLPALYKLLKQNNVGIKEIAYLFITHFHPDHAGLAQDLKDLGIKLILHECQVTFVEELNSFFKRNPGSNFKNIDTKNNVVFSSADSRRFLKNAGIDGELLPTPGHSEDSVGLIIDGCCAFIGDLPDFSLAEGYNDPKINGSWELIRSYNVRTIYPAHGLPYKID